MDKYRWPYTNTLKTGSFKYYADAMHSAIKEGLYRIKILCRRHPFWSYPRRVNNSWPAGLTKAEVSPSVCTPLSLSVYCYTGMCFHPVTSWLWPTVNPSFLAGPDLWFSVFKRFRTMQLVLSSGFLNVSIFPLTTTEPIFALRMIQGKHFEKKDKIYIMIFVDIEKA